MYIIHKYLIKEILKYFCVVLVVVIAIYLAVEFFEKIDNFIEKSVPLSHAVKYFIMKTPFIVAQIAPVGILLAVIIVLGLMGKNNELTALKSSGIGAAFLLKPILVMGVVFSIGLFFLSDLLVPFTMSRADHIWLREVKKKTSAFTKKKDIWIRSKDKIIHVKYYNPARQTAFGLTVNYFNPDFKLVKRIDAEKGEQKGDGWLLSGVMQQTVDTAGDNHRVAFREAMAISLDLSRDSLQRMVKKSEEMRFFELLKYIRDIETDGYDAVPYRVDLQAKIAFPFVCIIMCLAGAGIVIRKTSGQGIATGIAWGISIAFLYWIFYSFCVSLGYGGILPPLVSVWLANFVFLCLGIVVVQKNV
ncbi:MAG: LPS export ABC transporter permease LptG [Desulfobacteraceae bacterium 4572_123]|nr:MAG: LPS export ABC transporter permease LptG [Desulfobacteraceae bacterium 4572_123]